MISDACSSGVNAVDLARLSIVDGFCDVALAGGTDASVTPMGLDCYCVLGAVSRRNDDPQGASRPFDRAPNGFVLGEGSAMVVLEELERARARGAHIYGEVAGFAQTTDAVDLHHFADDGVQYARAMRLALGIGDPTPDHVGYVSADGRGTSAGDRAEARALRHLLGDWLSEVPVSAPKSMVGNTLTGAGPLDLAFTALAMRDGTLPPPSTSRARTPNATSPSSPPPARTKRSMSP